MQPHSRNAEYATELFRCLAGADAAEANDQALRLAAEVAKFKSNASRMVTTDRNFWLARAELRRQPWWHPEVAAASKRRTCRRFEALACMRCGGSGDGLREVA